MIRGFRTRDAEHPWLYLSHTDDFGLVAYDLLRPSSRFWSDKDNVTEPARLNVDEAEISRQATPVELLTQLPPGDNWQAMSRRSLGQLSAWFLVAEDRQQRFVARQVATLAHQASLVQHIVETPSLQNVLIADEVGLGKTIEAAMLVERLIRTHRDMRVLYLAPARLVRNVREEFDKLGLHFRMWVAGDESDARLEDRRIVASIHRACHPAHLETVVAARPWDLIIVDEAHHLSDWAQGGGKPVRKYKLVDELRDRMPSHGRLVLMTGTPHQGHRARFQNLLTLLRRRDEPEDAVSGRVIYRTKEDVRDWDKAPLFPKRQVNPPLVLELAPGHLSWLNGIHELFQPDSLDKSGQARSRAMGWRCGQALQWATSSVSAGLGYLVRQALRADMNADILELRSALQELRPYRNGPANEPIEQLFQRIAKEVGRQRSVGDVEDIEEEHDDDGWVPDEGLLRQLLTQGVALLRRDPDAKWRFLKERVLDRAGDEKVVLFAQPIETVTALARYLELLTGQRPAVIIGAQSEPDRQVEITKFWRPDGPRFLVSSRAGGEGLNLQVARRLVHVDVPWNPMELEQRVGRVHRFMSRKTILVDTIVVKDSRETDMYDVAQRKLEEVTKSLALDSERADALFARVMALVPPEEIAAVLTERSEAPLNDSERDQIANLVAQGFESWKEFHDRYATEDRIAQLDPGAATWRDVRDFARRHLKATAAEGFSALGFRFADGEVIDESKDADVVEVGRELFAVGDYGGMPVTDATGRPAKLLGLNVPVLADKLRELAFPVSPSGAAYLGWPSNTPIPVEGVSAPFGVLVAVRQSVQSVEQWREVPGVALHVRLIPRDGDPFSLESQSAAELIRQLLDGTIRRDPDEAPGIVERMRIDLQALYRELCKPSLEDRENGIRHAALPLLAAIVT